MTLWRVGDDGTVDFMRHFYGRLAAGVSRAEALRQTQLRLARDGSPPEDWAPFVLSGAVGPLKP